VVSWANLDRKAAGPGKLGPAIGEKRNETGLLGWAGERMLRPSGQEASWFT
jgi:hypothetical protein